MRGAELSLEGGPANVVVESTVPLVDQLWNKLRPIINASTENIKPLLLRLGVEDDELSPFCRVFDSSAELLAVYDSCFRKISGEEEETEGDDAEQSTAPSDGDDVDFDALEEAIEMAMDNLDAEEETVVPVEVDDLEVDDGAVTGDADPSLISSHLSTLLKADTVEDLAKAAADAIECLQVKKSGSTSPATKHRSLWERWTWSEEKGSTEVGDLGQDRIVKRNVRVRIEVKEGRGSNEMKAVEDFRVVVLYTKTYNKWYLCEKGKQRWNAGIKKGKFRALVRMIQFDHSNGKFKDVKPAESMKWGKKTVFVLSDASSINDVLGELTVEN